MEELFSLGESKRHILESLMGVPGTVHDLADALNIRENAIREHMEMLEAMGLIESKFVKAKVGRPKKIYSITEKGMELFPKKYDLLLKILLDELTRENGAIWVRDFLRRAGERIAKDGGDRKNDLNDLLAFYNALGCMATAIEKDGNIVIKRNNCIYYNLAMQTDNILCGTFEDSLVETMLPSYRVIKKDTVSKGKFGCEITLAKN